MAKVRYGSIVTELKGHIQGQVFQGGNVGFVLRNKGYTPGISNVRRQFATSVLSTVTATWRSLSDAQRSQWASLALTWPFVDKFGNTYYGSGFQVFTAYNAALVQLDEDQVLVPNAFVMPTDPGTITLTTLTTSAFAFTVPNTDLESDNLIVFASAPVSAGRNGNNIRMNKIDIFDYSISPPFSLFTKYVNVYGNYHVGAKIFLKFVVRNSFFPFARYIQYVNGIVA